jgi:hypothetical protein
VLNYLFVCEKKRICYNLLGNYEKIMKTVVFYSLQPISWEGSRLCWEKPSLSYVASMMKEIFVNLGIFFANAGKRVGNGFLWAYAKITRTPIEETERRKLFHSILLGVTIAGVAIGLGYLYLQYFRERPSPVLSSEANKALTEACKQASIGYRGTKFLFRRCQSPDSSGHTSLCNEEQFPRIEAEDIVGVSTFIDHAGDFRCAVNVTKNAYEKIYNNKYGNNFSQSFNTPSLPIEKFSKPELIPYIMERWNKRGCLPKEPGNCSELIFKAYFRSV